MKRDGLVEENIKTEIMLLVFGGILGTLGIITTIAMFNYCKPFWFIPALPLCITLCILCFVVYDIYYKLSCRYKIRKIVSSEMRNTLWILFEENKRKELAIELEKAKIEQEQE